MRTASEAFVSEGVPVGLERGESLCAPPWSTVPEAGDEKSSHSTVGALLWAGVLQVTGPVE